MRNDQPYEVLLLKQLYERKFFDRDAMMNPIDRVRNLQMKIKQQKKNNYPKHDIICKSLTSPINQFINKQSRTKYINRYSLIHSQHTDRPFLNHQIKNQFRNRSINSYHTARKQPSRNSIEGSNYFQAKIAMQLQPKIRIKTLQKYSIDKKQCKKLLIPSKKVIIDGQNLQQQAQKQISKSKQIQKIKNTIDKNQNQAKQKNNYHNFRKSRVVHNQSPSSPYRLTQRNQYNSKKFLKQIYKQQVHDLKPWIVSQPQFF